MLQEAERLSIGEDRKKFRWVLGRAEEIPNLGLGTFEAVTLAQSFHWTDKEMVAAIIYEALTVGGSLVLIHHNTPSFAPGKPETVGTTYTPPHPPIPHEVINRVLLRWLGHGKPPPDPYREPYRDFLMRTQFTGVESLVLPGRRDLVRTPDQVIDNYLSTSFAAPDLFGAHLADFRRDLAAELQDQTDTGFFWEWPGDTVVLIARKSQNG
jgi:hypothetical protein